jgi:protocatechuate 3,4-dioxygenase alpha subunit
MDQTLGYLKESASQTAGPYVHIGLTPNFSGMTGVFDTDLGSGPLYRDGVLGEKITVIGRIFDGMGAPIRDALIEIWQADAGGLYNSPSERRGKSDPAFIGWGRCPTDMDTGVFTFETIRPGRVPYVDGRMMAPHLTLWIVARGINIGLHTRMYFGDEPAANAEDPILLRIEHRSRLETLIGKRDGANFVFDIHLQGDRETIFFDI